MFYHRFLAPSVARRHRERDEELAHKDTEWAQSHANMRGYPIRLVLSLGALLLPPTTLAAKKPKPAELLQLTDDTLEVALAAHPLMLVNACADTGPYRTYGLHVPASCVPDHTTPPLVKRVALNWNFVFVKL